MAEAPTVSIVIPCRNEKDFIGQCISSIVESHYPKDRLEVLVVDGMSGDGTVEVLSQLSRQYPFVRILENPKRITPVAFNIGIRESHGDFIMIMSAHATYDPDAIRKCVEYAARYGADNVGGIWKVHTRGEGWIQESIGKALSHKFGVGGAAYRTNQGGEPTWVDTAAYGCYRRSVFSRIGLFNEKLVRGQDMELNLRLKGAGGRTLLAPDVVINYFARTDFLSFCRHNFRNGLWAILPFVYSTIVPVSVRHLVPGFFVLGLILSFIMLVGSYPLVFFLIVLSYLAASIIAAIDVAVRQRKIWYLLSMPIAFWSLHLCYGVGSVWGVVYAGTRRLFRLSDET